MTKIDIIKHLESAYGSKWVFGGKLAREIRELYGTKESVVERRCRELVVSGILEKRLVQIEDKGPKVVQYRVVKESPMEIVDKWSSNICPLIEQSEKLPL